MSGAWTPSGFDGPLYELKSWLDGPSEGTAPIDVDNDLAVARETVRAWEGLITVTVVAAGQRRSHTLWLADTTSALMIDRGFHDLDGPRVSFHRLPADQLPLTFAQAIGLPEWSDGHLSPLTEFTGADYERYFDAESTDFANSLSRDALAKVWRISGITAKRPSEELSVAGITAWQDAKERAYLLLRDVGGAVRPTPTSTISGFEELCIFTERMKLLCDSLPRGLFRVSPT